MKQTVALIAAALAAASAPASASTLVVDGIASASFGFGLQGDVQVSCNVRLAAAQAPIQGALVDLGTMNEFCNSTTGYDVYVDYAPQLAGARLLVDGQAVQLTDAGSLRIDGSDGQDRKSHQLQLDLGSTGASDPALSFRIAPR